MLRKRREAAWLLENLQQEEYYLQRPINFFKKSLIGFVALKNSCIFAPA
jgi:hypothetical protein